MRLLVLALLLFTMGCSRVESGYVGIKVNLLGSDKGVDSEELGPGRYHIGFNEELHRFPTFQQNYVWSKSATEGSPTDESITFQTIEGMACNVDIGIAYHLDKSKISTIFQTYRKGIEEITDFQIRNHVRDAINKVSSTMPVESVYGKGKTQFLSDVTALVKSELEPQGILIDKLSLVGNIRIPATVKSALNAKVQATQRAQQRENELREAKAGAAKAVAIAQGEAKKQVALSEGKAEALLTEAKAQAKANRILAASVTTTLVEYEKIKRWDGKLPTMTGVTGSILLK